MLAVRESPWGKTRWKSRGGKAVRVTTVMALSTDWQGVEVIASSIC